MAQYPSLLEKTAEEGTLELELREFIRSHSHGSVFHQYECYGVGAEPATGGLSTDLDHALPETRRRALKVGEDILNEFLDSYAKGGEVDLDAFDVLCTVYFHQLAADLDKLITAVKMTDRSFDYKTTWYFHNEVNVQVSLLSLLSYNQNKATEAQKTDILSIWENIWESYPKEEYFAAHRWTAFFGIIGLNEERVVGLYPQFIEERKKYCGGGGDPIQDVDFEMRARRLDTRYGFKLASTPEEIAYIDQILTNINGYHPL